jgi:tRNA (guanine-N7-)-methyltransferase
MALSKLEKFAALQSMGNVFENMDYHDPKLLHLNKYIDPKNHWRPSIFKNNNPIVLELACGRGEYTVALARKYPQINFVGVDVKGNRIHTGADIALREGLSNVAFVRTYIQLLHHFFGQDEIDEIWITFPDPFPKFGDRMNRLISPRFLDYYKNILTNKKTTYHLKTDNFPLFRYAVGVIDGRDYEIVQCTENIYGKDKRIDDILRIQTYYERLHQSKGSEIHYVQFVM